jgi:PucR family transcriptional regulator, purine catabolism regulatory protein
MATPARETTAGLDLAALEEVTAAVESGAGLPELARAAARALDAGLVVLDRTGAVLASASRSPADERSLLERAAGVETADLRVADAVVGELRWRPRSGSTSALAKLVATIVASEVERLRAPERASAEAVTSLLHDVLARGVDRAHALARGKELGIDLEGGGVLVVARAHPLAPTDEGWRARVLNVAERGARGAASGALATLWERSEADATEVVVLFPGADDALGQRAAEAVLRELETNLAGFSFAVGRSRPAPDPGDLARAADEALLAANVAEGREERSLLAFEETGAYRLLLSAMSEDPGELQRFYAETLEPLVAYDEQYETDLVATVEAYLEADGNVAGTAQRLFTHRHTIRYRLERVRELSGLDMSSSDGREKLSLGLKAMRVLGIAAPVGPATEAGAEAGRVPGRAR